MVGHTVTGAPWRPFFKLNKYCRYQLLTWIIAPTSHPTKWVQISLWTSEWRMWLLNCFRNITILNSLDNDLWSMHFTRTADLWHKMSSVVMYKYWDLLFTTTTTTVHLFHFIFYQLRQRTRMQSLFRRTFFFLGGCLQWSLFFYEELTSNNNIYYGSIIHQYNFNWSFQESK